MTTPALPVARPHRRQFLLGPGLLPARERPGGWISVDVGGGRTLDRDPELRLGWAEDLDARRWWLLGAAVDVRESASPPAVALGGTRTREVEALTAHWSGRWLLIGEERVLGDATAMLGCLYGRDGDGALWVSSSTVLLARALGLAPDAARREGRDASRWAPAPDATLREISWYPPPAAKLEGIDRLLPSQTLGLADGAPRRTELVVDRPSAGADDDARVTALADGARRAMRRLAALDGDREPTLLLSGGRDSRLLLALARRDGLAVRAFTRVHRRASVADRRLPPLLAELAGSPWSYRRQRRELDGRRELLLEHGGYTVGWLSAQEFLEGGSDDLEGIVLAGFCAELGRDRMLPEAPDGGGGGGDGGAGAPDALAIARHFGDDHPALVAALERWLAWCRAEPQPLLSLADRFFLEQRTAGRKGAKEQLADLFPSERVSPLNSRVLLGAIAGMSPRLRDGAAWIERIVATAAPALAELPANPPDASFGPWHGRIANPGAWRRLAKRVGVASG